MLHHAADKAGRTANCQTVCMGQTGKTEIFYADFVLQTGCHADQHAGCLCRFGKEYMHIISEKLFKAESNTTGCAANAAGNINEQRMLCIHNDILFCKLLYDTLCRYRIAKEQRYGVFIINEVAIGIGIGIFTPNLNCFAVVIRIFHNLGTSLAKQVFLPLLCICGHMYDYMEAQSRTHDTDRHTQIACGANLNFEFAEKFFEFIRSEYAVVIVLPEHTMFQSQILCMLQHLIDTAASLYGAGDCQMAVLL